MKVSRSVAHSMRELFKNHLPRLCVCVCVCMFVVLTYLSLKLCCTVCITRIISIYFFLFTEKSIYARFWWTKVIPTLCRKLFVILLFIMVFFIVLLCKSESPLKKKKWSHWDRSCAAANFLHLIVCKHFYRQNQLHILFCFCCSFNCRWFGCFLRFFFCLSSWFMCCIVFFFLLLCIWDLSLLVPARLSIFVAYRYKCSRYLKRDKYLKYLWYARNRKFIN